MPRRSRSRRSRRSSVEEVEVEDALCDEVKEEVYQSQFDVGDVVRCPS